MSTAITLKLPAAWGQSLGTQPTPVEVAGSHAPALRVICAWCGLRMVDGPADAPVSHGICEPCAAKVEAEDGEGMG